MEKQGAIAGNPAILPRQGHTPKPKNLPFAQGLLATSPENLMEAEAWKW
jgi:hypothetical protein